MNESAAKIRPVILSGGSGTRLWPESRHKYPKQFSALFGESSLFERTLLRVSDRTRYASPLIISNVEHKFHVLGILAKLNITDATILLEPMARNTAAACIIAALYEMDAQIGVLHLVMPSDHIILREDVFHAAIASAADAAHAGEIILCGIKPHYPETGYGYIMPAVTTHRIKKIDAFFEKPDAGNAAYYITQGALWNGGIFLYEPAMLLREAKHLSPEHVALCEEALSDAKPDEWNTEYNSILLPANIYKTIENISFDTLIMEHTTYGSVIECNMGWSDVGSWKALYDISEKDTFGNVFLGDVIAQETSNSYIRTEGQKIAVMGMKNCAIIAKKDVVYIAPISESQKIKALVSTIEAHHKEIVAEHVYAPRPWGTYEIIARSESFLVKKIVVWPGRFLSAQKHEHRAEHWVVVAGKAKVECDGATKMVLTNESFFVPKGARHRLGNEGEENLIIIEIQTGEHISEEDIIRFEDMYGRV